MNIQDALEIVIDYARVGASGCPRKELASISKLTEALTIIEIILEQAFFTSFQERVVDEELELLKEEQYG